MTDVSVHDLERMACRVREGIVQATCAAKSGHPGGSLGAADIFTTLFFSEMAIDPQNPSMPGRDRFVLSKGHTAPGLYSVMAHRGFFPVEELLTLRKQGSRLQGHPSMRMLPGVEMSTGSLGQGVSTAAGMALAAKHNGETNRVYTLLGDGELAEGECWEAFMFAAHYKLDNLCVIIDLNGLQIDGPTAEVMDSSPVDKKMEAFGFEVIPCDGNSIPALLDAFKKARAVTGRPACILAKTVKGSGVSFMENQASWHGKAPSPEQAEAACGEIGCKLCELEGK